MAKGAEVGEIKDAIVQIGGSERFESAMFRFKRAQRNGMVKHGFHFRHMHVSNFDSIRTPAVVTFKLLAAILNLLLAVLFVPGAVIRAATNAGEVVGAIRGSLPGEQISPGE